MTPDYSMGKACALFLSLKYHLLHKDYILTRIKRLSAGYKCYILLCLVDIEETSNSQVLQDLAILSLTADFTLILAWRLLLICSSFIHAAMKKQRDILKPTKYMKTKDQS